MSNISTNFVSLEYSYLQTCKIFGTYFKTFDNIPLEETIEICTNELFKESKTVEGLSKTEFNELLSLATKDLHFIVDGTLYKQIDGVAMGFPLGPTLANAFLVYHEKNWLEHCPVEYRPLCYRRYVDGIFVLFNSAEHLKRFYSFLNRVTSTYLLL